MSDIRYGIQLRLHFSRFTTEAELGFLPVRRGGRIHKRCVNVQYIKAHTTPDFAVGREPDKKFNLFPSPILSL